jgi:hypothetical protein
MSDQKYKIVAVPNFYEPDIAGNNRPYVVCEDDGQTERIFDSVDDAEASVDDLDSDIYVATNGEAGRPAYYIVEAGYDISYDDQGNYNWDGNNCTDGDDDSCCGECDKCIEMMIDQDRDRVIANAIEED